LVIAGFEPDYYKSYQKKLEALTLEMGLGHKIIFTGFIAEDIAHTLFSMAEVVVLPYAYSLSASGPLSIAIQHRKPIVATKTTFFKETLKEDYNALLVPPMDSESLAVAIEKLLSDASLRERLSKNINFEAEICSWDKVGKATLEAYTSICEG
jgi:glycosyltransferase involved in cell wall biosynthesis